MARSRPAAVILIAAAVTIAIPLAAPEAAGARTGRLRVAGPGQRDGATRAADLPLGPPDLTQTSFEQTLAPGVRLETIVRGRASSADSWVLRSLQPSLSAADGLATRIRTQGLPARVQRVDERAADDPVTGPLGWLVVSEGYPSEASAQQAASALSRSGIPGVGVSNTALYRAEATGPWVVRVLTVQRRQLRQVHAQLATDVVPGRETTSSVAARLGAVAAVNGGYFVVGDADGTPGDPAGVAVQDGRLDSEAVGDRAALVLSPRSSRIASVTTRLGLRSADGSVSAVNGVDRSVGRIRDCGAPGDLPTERPQQDVTCTNPDEIVVFDEAFGATAEEGPGVALTLDRGGRIVQIRAQRGGTIPTGGRVVEGIGAGGTWLTAHAHIGQRLRITTEVRAAGVALRLTAGTGIVNGGPFLVRDGRVSVDAFGEGFVHPDDPGFYFAFAVARNPRTMAGLTERGDLLLVTVDGRQPGYSIGMSFREQADVMRALGARVAVNLDGGGSTAMAVQGRLLGRPSDSTGERPVGDVIAVLPGRAGDVS